jgi:hypothetical protein
MRSQFENNCCQVVDYAGHATRLAFHVDGSIWVVRGLGFGAAYRHWFETFGAEVWGVTVQNWLPAIRPGARRVRSGSPGRLCC